MPENRTLPALHGGVFLTPDVDAEIRVPYARKQYVALSYIRIKYDQVNQSGFRKFNVKCNRVFKKTTTPFFVNVEQFLSIATQLYRVKELLFSSLCSYIFWSTGSMDCMLVSFQIEIRSCARGQWCDIFHYH